MSVAPATVLILPWCPRGGCGVVLVGDEELALTGPEYPMAKQIQPES
jgi:hypothetical protein